MTTFKMQYPPEPPIGSIVKANDGSLFKRINNFWKFHNNPSFQRYTWLNILNSFREVTLVDPEPEEGDIRMSKIDSDDIIIYFNGKWNRYELLGSFCVDRLDIDDDEMGYFKEMTIDDKRTKPCTD